MDNYTHAPKCYSNICIYVSFCSYFNRLFVNSLFTWDLCASVFSRYSLCFLVIEKTTSYGYSNPHYKPKAVWQRSQICNGNPYTKPFSKWITVFVFGKTTAESIQSYTILVTRRQNRLLTSLVTICFLHWVHLMPSLGALPQTRQANNTRWCQSLGAALSTRHHCHNNEKNHNSNMKITPELLLIADSGVNGENCRHKSRIFFVVIYTIPFVHIAMEHVFK